MITNVFLKNFLKEVTLIRFTNKNLQKLVNEMFKVNNGLSVQLVIEHFYFKENHYNFTHQSGTKFKVEHVKTETNGKQSVSCLGTKTWNSIPRHCAKSFQIRSFFCLYIPVFGLNMEIFSVNLRIHSKYRKIRTRKIYIWTLFTQEIKNVTTLAAFKIKIKRRKPICKCRICRIYIQRVGFI